MARAQVVHVKCDRCKREELQPMGPPKERPDFEGCFMDKKVSYNDLCLKCRETISNIWDDLREWNRQIVHTMWKGQAIPDDKAPPMNPAPDYSPPKPHSLAASKK